MERERLLQILDNSACLTNRQIEGYLKHSLFPEEQRVVELHLNRCPLCSDALDGLEQYEQQLGDALIAMPLIELPVLSLPDKPKEKQREPITYERSPNRSNRFKALGKQDSTGSTKNWGTPIGIAAALVLGFGTLWYFKWNNNNEATLIVQNTDSYKDSSILLKDNNALSTEKTTAALQEVDNQPTVQTAPIADTTILLAKVVEEKQSITQVPADPLVAMTAAVAPAAEAASADKEVAIDNIKQNEEEVALAAAAAKKKKANVAAEKERKQVAESRKEPPATRSQFRIGMEQYNKEEYDQAIGYFKQAESNASDPNHWEAVYYTGMSYKALGKKRRAIRQFKMVAESNHRTLKASAEKRLEEMK